MRLFDETQYSLVWLLFPPHAPVYTLCSVHLYIDINLGSKVCEIQNIVSLSANNHSIEVISSGDTFVGFRKCFLLCKCMYVVALTENRICFIFQLP